MTEDLALLLARTCLASPFLYSGAMKLAYWQDSAKELSALRLPRPNLWLSGTIAVQLAGSLCLIAGLQTVPAAILLGVFTLAATLIGHPFWQFRAAERIRALTTALEHMAIVAGFALIILTGPGRYSLSALL